MSDETSPRTTPFIAHGKEDPPPQLALDLLMDESEEFEDSDSTKEDPMDDPNNLRIDDLDPDMFDSGMPEDF